MTTAYLFPAQTIKTARTTARRYYFKKYCDINYVHYER